MRNAKIVILLVLTVLMVTACSGQTDTQPSNGDNESSQTDGNGQPASGQQTDYPTNEGATPVIGEPSTFDEGTQPTLPEGWREDVPLFEGFVVDEFRGQSDGMMAICKGNLDIDTVTQFYSNLEKWQKDPDPERPWVTEGSDRRLTYIQDNLNMVINLTSGEGLLIMSIMIIRTSN
jgi:hypothetical protein